MTVPVLRQAFRTTWKGWAWYALGTAATIAAMASIANDYVSVLKQATDLLKNYPKAMLDAFQINSATFGTPVGFMSGEILSLIWPFILVALASGAAAAVTGMIEDGTIHFDLSLPIGRVSWLAQRWATSVAWLALFVAASVGALHLFVAAPWWRFGLLGFALGFLALGFSYAVAAFSSQKAIVSAAAFGVFVVEWLLATVAGSSSNATVHWLGRLSIWGDWRPEAVVNNGLDWTPIVTWLVLGLVFSAVAAWRWRGRDVPA